MEKNGDISPAGTPLVQWMVDKQGVFTLSEGEGLATLGLAPGEFVGKSIFDVYADVPQILENVRSALGGQIVESTVEFTDMVWECHYYPTGDPNGVISGVVGTALNITEQRKQVQEQEVVVNFAAALRTASTRAEMPPIILDRITDLLKVDNMALIIRNPSNGTMTIERAQGIWGGGER
ncbi:MAG: PAS domain-containing protein [Anaerolineales bacterium]|nr:PAS domain-containing protein [Anaerolineales bacterium]